MLRFATLLTTAGALVTLAATAASAHTPFIYPSRFAPDRDFVTITAGVTEGNFFVSDFPIRGEGEYLATDPSSVVVKLGSGTVFKEFAIIEAALPKEGTWRLSTGDRAGRSSEFAKIDGQWRSVRAAPQPGAPRPPPRPPGPPPQAAEAPRLGPVEASDVPAGAERIKSVNYLKAETFVSRGAPSSGGLKATGQGFEFTPVTHPNEIYAGEPFAFVFTQDGQPAQATFTVVRAYDALAEKRFSASGKTDAAGRGSLTIPEPGVYVLETRYPERAEGPTAPPPAKATGYTLTFEVTR